MIKWAGYGKSLKLLSFGLLISFFTLFVGSSVNASNGSHFQLVGISSSSSFLDSQYEITFLKGGGLNTMFLGQARNIFALNSTTMFWWGANGLPYLYYSKDDQGYFSVGYSCDSMNSGGQYVVPTNCSSFDINAGVGPTIFKSFFSTIKQNDVVYYYYYNDGRPYWSIVFKLCFDSSELNKSLCFDFGKDYTHPNDTPLTGSLGLDVQFTTVPYSVLGYAPGQVGYDGQYGGSEGTGGYGEIDGFLTGSVITQECTVGYAKNYAENLGLNRFVCYGGLDIDASQYSIATAGTGATVFQIFQNSNNGLNFSDWFTYRNNIYKNRYTYDSSVWSGTPAPLYSYFQFYNEYGSQFSARDIQDYCKIIVNNMSLTGIWNGNQSRCPSIVGNNVGGGGGSSWGDDDFSGGVVGGGGSSTFNNVISVNWDGVGNHSTNEVKTPSAYITDFFNKAREVIPTNFTGIGGGFLPTYIITFFCAIILFRFLRH